MSLRPIVTVTVKPYPSFEFVLFVWRRSIKAMHRKESTIENRHRPFAAWCLLQLHCSCTCTSVLRTG